MAHVVAAPRRLVDVVAEKDEQVEVVAGHAMVSAVVALLVLLAGREREAQPLERGVDGGRGPGPPDRTHLGAGAESVPVPASRLESVDLDVNGVGPRRTGRGRAPSHDLAHPVVAGHLPVDDDDVRRHSPARHERRRRQPRPEHDAIGQRIAGRHTQREGRGGEFRLGSGSPRQRCDERRRPQGDGAPEELPPAEPHSIPTDPASGLRSTRSPHRAAPSVRAPTRSRAGPAPPSIPAPTHTRVDARPSGQGPRRRPDREAVARPRPGAPALVVERPSVAAEVAERPHSPRGAARPARSTTPGAKRFPPPGPPSPRAIDCWPV